MTEGNEALTSRRLEEFRRNLLDTSMRNRLINFRTHSSKGKPLDRVISVVGESPDALMDILVNESKPMSFLGKPDPKKTKAKLPSTELGKESDSQSELTDPSEDDIDILPQDEDESTDQFDLKLNTLETLTSLDRKLTRIWRDSKVALEEQGVNILFLALGSLEWYEQESSEEKRVAPLILLPVSLDRIQSGAFRIRWDGSELGSNLSLGALLRRDEYGLKLPDLPEEIVPSRYFELVAKAVQKKSRWKVDLNSVALGFFSYAKYLMYRDLDPAAWPIEEHPAEHKVLKPLLSNGFEGQEQGISEGQQVDYLRSVADTCEVYDSDSSQTLAILESQSGRTMVIEGPPGTGKSQTITNLISEAVVAGKRVLFIAEKAAALDVVFRRLKEAQLEEACLELHSNKANKKQFYGELSRTVKIAAPRTAQMHTEERRLEAAKKQLNSYVEAVNTLIDGRDISPRLAMGRLIALGAEVSPEGRHDFESFKGWSEQDFQKKREVVQKLEAQVLRMGRPVDHPYFGCTLDHLLPQDKDDLGVSLEQSKSAIEQFHKEANQLAVDLMVELPVRPSDTNILQACVNFVTGAPDLDGVRLNETGWEEFSPELVTVLEKGKRLSEAKLAIEKQTAADVSNLSVKDYQDLLRLKTFVQDDFQHFGASELAFVLAALYEVVVGAQKHLSLLRSLAGVLQVDAPTTLWAVEPLVALLQKIADGPNLNGMAVATGDWANLSDVLRSCINDVSSIQSNHAAYDSRLSKEAWTASISNDLDTLKATSARPLRILNSSYRRVMKATSGIFLDGTKAPEERVRALEAVRDTQNAMKRLAELRGKCSVMFGEKWKSDSSDPLLLSECLSWIEEIRLSVATGKTPQAVLVVLERGIDHGQLRKLADEVRESHALLISKLRLFRQAVAERGSRKIEDGTGDANEHVWSFATSHFLPNISEFTKLISQGTENYFKTLLEFFDLVAEFQELKLFIQEKSGFARQFLGDKWLDEATHWDSCQNVVSWTLRLRAAINENQLPKGIVDFFLQRRSKDGLSDAIRNAQKSREVAQNSIKKVLVQAQLHDDPAFFVEEPIGWQRERLATWVSKLDDLPQLIRYNSIVEEASREGLAESVEKADSWQEAGRELTKAFSRSWYTGVLREAIYQRPEIARFDRQTHEETIVEFRQLDDFVLAHNRAKVALAHWRNVPRGSAGGAMGWLMTMFNLSRGHKPIRIAMEKAGEAIQAIKPVFLMSPLSVAMYLPAVGPRFDMVIFDEASQVKPEDAFGGIIRAGQTIVVGDSKQMPPTSFFDKVTSDAGDIDEEEEDFDDEGHSMKELESILAMMNSKIPEVSPRRRDLRWHYRSKHDALIATSNRLYYNDRLVVFPSPWRYGAQGGLILRHDPTTVYGRGGSRKNIEEARAVARAAHKHVLERPHLSLGIAAFSKAQQDAINDELELLRKEDPAFQEFDNKHPFEKLFVKNLENIQGDERDVIFISVGYGRDENGFITASFGPLNRDGGERRLNVLISRARKRCEVFTNIKSEDVRLTERPSKGVLGLKTFLAFADTGSLDVPSATDIEPQSPFEEEVLAMLRNHGYDVDPQVGSCGFYIDLAVKHPEHLGRYVLGIECDGAMYHRARSARDRDKLRQAVLESRGWRIHRIWSTDWFNNQSREFDRLVKAIESAMHLAVDEIELFEPASKPIEYQPLEREELDSNTDSQAPAYAVCDLNVDLRGLQLHEVPSSRLADWIRMVVQKESPVHFDEVTRRIREAAGIGRAGTRIVSALEVAGQRAENTFALIYRDGFFYKSDKTDITVRSRRDFPQQSKKLEYVSLEEIVQALVEIVEASFVIEKEEASSLAVRKLGFDRMTSQMNTRMEAAIELAVAEQKLRLKDSELRLP